MGRVQDWIARSDVDYIGPFVNAWAAFNAWYRDTANSRYDRVCLDHVRTNANTVRSGILPLLDPLRNPTQDSDQFRGFVGDLHSTLEAYKLELTNDDGVLEHVNFRNVPRLRPRQALPLDDMHRNIRYRIVKSNGQWLTTVVSRTGAETARIEQISYDVEELTNHRSYRTLPQAQQVRLRVLYSECNPRPRVSLLDGNEREIICGTIPFKCTDEDLFGGIIETVYRMRNMLLHGELSPDPKALACYQPAYHILRRILEECR